jgi:NitT/TauT family transport system permease protein
MFEAVLSRLGRMGSFLWAGWSGLAGLALLAALWQAGHEAYGAFILPSPLETLAAGAAKHSDGPAGGVAMLTSNRAVEGFAV